MGRVPLTTKKRLVIAFTIFVTVMVCLCIRDGYIQIVKSSEYTKMAVAQQITDQVVEAKRGDIVDRNGTKMAVSTIAYSVWVRPSSIMDSTADTEEEREAENQAKLQVVADGLAEILDLDAEDIMEDFNSGKTLVKVAKYLELATANEVRTFASENGIDAISISEESKRYYPLSTMAAQILGSVTDDNNGLSGLELYYNNYLQGVAGRWVQSVDASGNALSYGSEKYYEATDGATLVLTLDVVIQSYAEEACQAAYEAQNAEEVSCIVMDTNTGEILAMATYPGFDCNNPRVPGNSDDLEEFEEMSETDQLTYLNQMWRSPLINDTYIPGSTMKLVTTSMALEENLTTPEEEFYDSGSIEISGVTLKCWNYKEPHGEETLTKAVRNSCNPVFVELSQRIGATTFYEYLRLFGFTDTTGIDYPGEASAIIQSIDSVGTVGLATMSYGQGIAVTPIQLITAVNAIVNDGVMVQPHLVKEIVSADGETLQEFGTTTVRQVISEETAKQVQEIMQFVVDDGGAGTTIEGIEIGGKTGTSTVEAEDNMIIASFVGAAPMDDPQITVLFIVTDPQNAIYGSTVAAPSGMSVIEKTLQYLNLELTEE